MRAAGGSTRRIVSASVLLPEPDFADDPEGLAGMMRNDTSSTARTTRVP